MSNKPSLEKLEISNKSSQSIHTDRQMKYQGNPSSSKPNNDMLSSLMGTLNMDLGNSLHQLPPKPPPNDNLLLEKSSRDSREESTYASSSTFGKRYNSVKANTYLPSQIKDEIDFTAIKFGTECSLRGNIGRYMSAVLADFKTNGSTLNSINPNDSSISKRIQPTEEATTAFYNLSVKGQGISEPSDCLVFVNADQREDQGHIRYGMTISCRAPGAKERFLGVKELTKLAFFRNLIGQGEKWIILKGSTSIRGSEDIEGRGDYVRVGDLIVLQTASSEQFLAIHEGVGGTEARLIPKGAGGLGGELWQLELFRSQPLPTWMNRPYLSGKFLLLTPDARMQAPELEARTFPGFASSAGGAGVGARPHHHHSSNTSSSIPILNSYPTSVQHIILLRELLLAFSGIEGQYIRLAAATTVVSNSSGHQSSHTHSSSTVSMNMNIIMGINKAPTDNKQKMKDISLVIDLDTAERSAAHQVSLLLPICEHAIRIREFIKFHSRYEFGFVSHAVVAVVKSIMREFDILIAQLEHLLMENKLTLQKMTYLLHPAKATLSSVLNLTKHIRDSSGGNMLDKLYESLIDQGDSKARDLHSHIFQKASEPFLEMLSNWIYGGDLNDPYKEFLIHEDLSISKEGLQEDFNAQYWENRYRIRESHVPKILRDQAQRALIAGKYLNVIRGCVDSLGDGEDTDKHYKHSTNSTVSSNRAREGGRDDAFDHVINNDWVDQLELPQRRELKLDFNSGLSSINNAIEEAYALSSRALLKLLQEGHGLSIHLRSLRRFFLLEHGDFFIQFMDTAEDELRREVKEITLSRIQNLLQLAVQTSTLAQDPHREDISCSLASHNLIQHLHLIQSAGENSSDSYLASISQGLKGVEALTMDYSVGWPVSIVLSRRAITKYQLLSRLLYFSKHVERRVLSCWQDHQATKNLHVRAEMGTPYCLRHRMLHFLQNFVYYMTVEVISPRSHEMQAGMVEAQDIDEVLALHERFLDTCLKECLLASQDLLKVLTKLLTTCLLFADNLKKFAMDSEVVDEVLAATTSSTAGTGGAVEAVLVRRKIVQNARMKSRTEYIQRESCHEWFIKTLAKFALTFDSQLKEFLEKLWADSYRQHPQLSNLCVRIDYNGYYSSKFSGDGHSTSF